MAASFPMKIPELKPKSESGEMFYISNAEELRHLGNGTVPQALLADVTPPQYYNQQNATSDSDILSHLVAPSSKKRASRDVSSICPVTWVVSFEGNRWPTRISKAVCNGQGTTCLSANGHPSCEEYLMEVQIYRFLGITSNGQQIWRSERQTIPVACTCSSY